MPRDCTAVRSCNVPHDVQSYFKVVGSNTHLNTFFITWRYLFLLKMAKSAVYTTPKRKSNGAKKNNAPKPLKARIVTVPQSKSVSGSGPSKATQQELVIPVVPGANQFTLHPSNIPWMSGVAPSHQDWCLAGLRVWYEPRVGTTTAGTVAFGILTDFQDTVPLSLASITRLSGSKRGAPWTPCVLSSPSNRWVPYVSGSAFANLSVEDKNARSLGRIVAYADCDASMDPATKLGNIFISYNPAQSLRKPTDPTLQA